MFPLYIFFFRQPENAFQITGDIGYNVAIAIGVPVSTLTAWEQGPLKLSGTAETLLKLFQAHPEIVKALIEKQTQHKTQKQPLA